MRDFLQPVANVGFGEPAASAQLLQGLAEAALNAFEHVSTRPSFIGWGNDCRVPCPVRVGMSGSRSYRMPTKTWACHPAEQR